MLDIIRNNPYRILGVYSNSPKRDIVANQGRITAFARVGKACEFPSDFSFLLYDVDRTEDSIKDANAKLTLPAEQLKYAQFWFAKSTPFDEIALNKLTNSDTDGALDIWSKKDNASSLQNRVMLSLIKGDLSAAVGYAETLYSNYKQEFLTMIFGDSITISTDEIEEDFLDVLVEEFSISDLMKYISVQKWKSYVADKSVKPLIDEIESEISSAKATRGKGADARYKAGNALMENTKSKLSQLKKLLTARDMKYQMIADKLALEILQCGIDYYNDSDDDDAAYKAKPLQDYANKIAVGQMAKDRCRENVEILERIISELPPKEVMKDANAITVALRKFKNQPDKISYSIDLLNTTKPHMQSIKSKLGSTNEFYLKLSTAVVGNALHNVIEEVNDVQESTMVTLDNGMTIPLIPENLLRDRMKNVLKEAWKATQIMDEFDVENDFKWNRYVKQKSILRNLCLKVGVISPPFIPRTSPRSTGSTPSQPTEPTPFKIPAYVIGIIVSAVVGGIIGLNSGRSAFASHGFFDGLLSGAMVGAIFIGPLFQGIKNIMDDN